METFETQNLSVRRMTESDFDFFVTLTNDSTITKYFTSFSNIKNPKEEFYETIIGQQNHGNLFLVICLKNGTPIGILDAFYMANNEWLVEYALLKPYRKNGYIFELLSHICKHDFEFLSVFKTNHASISGLVFDIKSDNIASQKVVTKLARTLNLALDIDDFLYEITF